MTYSTTRNYQPQEAMESFAFPVRNEKSVKIDERFLSSDGGNILKAPIFERMLYVSKKNTILKTFTGNESSFVLQVFPLIFLQRFPILGFKHQKGTSLERLLLHKSIIQG